jgi:hypothetical protein
MIVVNGNALTAWTLELHRRNIAMLPELAAQRRGVE